MAKLTEARPPLRKKDRIWLDRIVPLTDRSAGMYPGIREDNLPRGTAHRLQKLGYIILKYPHNPVHYGRFIVTTEGRTALEET